jgi:hypothetical protein
MRDDDYDVLADGMKAAAVPVGMSWMWTLAFGHHEDRTPTHGYAARGRDGDVCKKLATGVMSRAKLEVIR